VTVREISSSSSPQLAEGGKSQRTVDLGTCNQRERGRGKKEKITGVLLKPNKSAKNQGKRYPPEEILYA